MDCVARERILPFSPFLLAAGENTYLRGAVRSRLLRAYDPTTARFEETFARREKLLGGKRVVFLMGKGKAEQRKKAYLFLTRASGAGEVMRVASMREAMELVLGGGGWDLLYVNDKDVTRAEASILEGLKEGRWEAGSEKDKGKTRKTGKRKWVEADKENEAPCAEQETKRVRVVGDEFVVQSLILGSLVGPLET
jgi:DNA repair protein RAD9